MKYCKAHENGNLVRSPLPVVADSAYLRTKFQVSVFVLGFCVLYKQGVTSSVCVCSCAYVCARVCMYVCARVCMYVCACVCVHSLSCPGTNTSVCVCGRYFVLSTCCRFLSIVQWNVSLSHAAIELLSSYTLYTVVIPLL